jgi:hypothetical protein
MKKIIASVLALVAAFSLSGSIDAHIPRGSPSGAGVTLPSAPQSLQVINEGGPNNGTYTGSYTFNGFSFQKANLASSDYEGLTWSPATPGSNSISKYNIYRNGTLYDSVSSPITITGFINTTTISTVAISGTAGQFTCACTLFFDELVTVTGTNTGSGSISGYTTGNTYQVTSAGTNSFSLNIMGPTSSLTTTAGTTTGLTFSITRLTASSVSGGSSTNAISDGKILAGLQLSSAASGFVAGTAITTYLNTPTGGGGTGTYAVNWPQNAGSSGSPVTFTGWAYNDTAATGAVSIGYTAPGATYVYTATAVDSASNEGPAAGANAYLFRGQAYNAGGNFDYGTVTTNYADHTCSSAVGPYAMLVTWPGPSDNGGFQPVYSSGNNSSLTPMGLMPLENFNSSGFQFLVMDVKVPDNTFATHPLDMAPIARGFGTTTGAVDVFLTGDTDINIVSGSFGTPVIGSWVTLKIPLNQTSYGTTNVQGFFVGTSQFQGTLTVTSVGTHTAAKIGGNAYVSGSGMPATSYVTGGTAGGVGSYTITGPNIVGTEVIGSSGSPVAFTLNRNISYKVGTQWDGAAFAGTTMCVDNYGFTAN